MFVVIWLLDIVGIVKKLYQMQIVMEGCVHFVKEKMFHAMSRIMVNKDYQNGLNVCY